MTEMILLLLATLLSFALGFLLIRRLTAALQEHRSEVSRKRAAPYGTAKPARRPEKGRKRTGKR